VSRPGAIAACVLALAALGLPACGSDEDASSEAREGGPAPPGQGGEERRVTDRGVPLLPGGDNSIQAFGAEASPGDRRALARTVQAYLDARVSGRWEHACPYLTGTLRSQLARLASPGPRPSQKGCAAILAGVHPSTPASIRAQKGPIRLLSVRVEGGTGFAIYRTRRSGFYYLPVAEEKGIWKVATVNATRLLG
jgi:hypothetical protein